MGLFDFIKDAGEKLFGDDDPATIAANIQKHIEKQSLGLSELKVTFDGEHKLVKLEGFAPNQDAFEKAALAAGNVSGVVGVYNFLKLPHQVAAEAAQAAVAAQQPAASAAAPVSGEAATGGEAAQPAAAAEGASRYHDVVKGDTLSAIAKKYYGDANQYNKIFEANKPMLSHPDKIYPGQKLRIPE